MSILPHVHRVQSRRLGWRLRQIPDTPMIGLTWGPISVLWDRQFKRVAREWKAAQ